MCHQFLDSSCSVGDSAQSQYGPKPGFGPYSIRALSRGEQLGFKNERYFFIGVSRKDSENKIFKRNDDSSFCCRRILHTSRTKAYHDRNWKASFLILFSDGMRFSDFVSVPCYTVGILSLLQVNQHGLISQRIALQLRQ